MGIFDFFNSNKNKCSECGVSIKPGALCCTPCSKIVAQRLWEMAETPLNEFEDDIIDKEINSATQDALKTIQRENIENGTVEVTDESRVNLTDLEQIDQAYYFKGEPFTGICEEQDNSGLILSKLTIVDGKIQLVTTYDDFGNIEEKTEWKNGKPNGLHKNYYASGELKGEATFKDGIIDGLLKQFFKNGEIKSQCEIKKGVKNGFHKYYYESGNIKGEEFFKNDKKDGPFKTFYENGHPKSKGKYKNDQEILSETKCFINDAPPSLEDRMKILESNNGPKYGFGKDGLERSKEDWDKL